MKKQCRIKIVYTVLVCVRKRYEKELIFFYLFYKRYLRKMTFIKKKKKHKLLNAEYLRFEKLNYSETNLLEHSCSLFVEKIQLHHRVYNIYKASCGMQKKNK